MHRQALISNRTVLSKTARRTSGGINFGNAMICKYNLDG